MKMALGLAWAMTASVTWKGISWLMRSSVCLMPYDCHESVYTMSAPATASAAVLHCSILPPLAAASASHSCTTPSSISYCAPWGPATATV